MNFKIEHNDDSTGARAGEISTSRGLIKTPVFMPVATKGAIRALTYRDIEEIGFDIILSNTYHLYIRPGTEVLKEAGGLHKFMNFNKPVLTDSGGFQVFSLNDLCKVRDNCVEFRSHLDGSKHFFSPEKVLDIQKVIGSDIMMVLDQCTGYPTDEKKAAADVERTLDWAGKSIKYYNKDFDHEKQALFGIVQGSVFSNLRKYCAERLVEMEFPGYAIGGLSVGEPLNMYQDMTSFTLEHLPLNKPRYMMGVGSPMEILYGIKYGIDMFDCVMPTRIARNGTLYTSNGRINIKAARYEKDFSSLDENCSCYVCRNFSKSYLRHIFKSGEIASLIYNTYHNLHFMKSFMEEIRESIFLGKFQDIYRKWENIYKKNTDSKNIN